jgi:hypothetical protein
MNNIIILGAGRSGTSALAGAIALGTGYNIGGVGHEPDKFNKKGYFETKEINRINDDILYRSPDIKLTQGKRQGWLSQLPIGSRIQLSTEQERHIKSIVQVQPFVFKDPRFSYTLRLWEPFLPDNTKIICVYRDPMNYIKSVMNCCNNAEYLKGIEITEDFVEGIWNSMYENILDHKLHNSRFKDWMFIEYYQLFMHTVGEYNFLDELENFIGNKIEKSFLDRSLSNFDELYKQWPLSQRSLVNLLSLRASTYDKTI